MLLPLRSLLERRNAVSPSAGNFVISGPAPTIWQPRSLTFGAGTLAILGYAPSISQPHGVVPIVGGLSILGYAPSVGQPHGVNPVAGSLVITGYAPTIEQPRSFSPSAGLLEILGHAPIVTHVVTRYASIPSDAVPEPRATRMAAISRGVRQPAHTRIPPIRQPSLTTRRRRN